MKIKELNNLILIWGVLSKESLNLFKNETVLVPENRPFLYGLKHNIPILKENTISFIYCTDNMLGYLFYKNKIKKTFIFYKEKTKNGYLAPCGSLYTSLLSKLSGVSVEFLGGAKVNFNDIDTDASTLGRKEIVSDDNKKWVEPARDEVINLEV